MKRHAPAADRNKEPILDVLRQILPERGSVLEIASGSGQHAVHFARAFESLAWQPSDPDAESRASIEAWRAAQGSENLGAPIELDVTRTPWPVDAADAVVCINMVHISPWEASLGLLDGAGAVLPARGVLYLYGPYRVDGETAPSNEAFDLSLQRRDARWGVRELRDVEREAVARGLKLERIVQMPANNLSVVFRRRD